MVLLLVVTQARFSSVPSHRRQTDGPLLSTAAPRVRRRLATFLEGVGIKTAARGYGSGDGDGDGHGSGHGSGYGSGSGSGHGSGYGDG
jgi:hypothetical protein